MYIFYLISFGFFLKLKVFRTNIVENIKTHISYSIILFRISCGLFDKVEKYLHPERPQMTVWYMHTPCWITKARHKHTHTHTHTHTRYLILLAFPLQQWLNESASILRYACIASFINYISLNRWSTDFCHSASSI